MFEFLKPNPAVALLKEDHARVKELFDQFEKAKSRPAKLKIVRAALTELKVHAAIEEELFYPAVRKPIGKEVMNEADEEHHVAKLLIAELDTMDGSETGQNMAEYNRDLKEAYLRTHGEGSGR